MFLWVLAVHGCLVSGENMSYAVKSMWRQLRGCLLIIYSAIHSDDLETAIRHEFDTAVVARTAVCLTNVTTVTFLH